MRLRFGTVLFVYEAYHGSLIVDYSSTKEQIMNTSLPAIDVWATTLR